MAHIRIWMLFQILGFSLLLSSQDRPGHIDVKAYHFEIEINDTTDIIVGSASIDLELKESTNSFTLDLEKKKGDNGMRITRVFVNGLPSCYHFGDDDKVYVKNNTSNWPVDKMMNVQVGYFGKPSDGLIISNNKFGKRSFFGDNWPNRAHHWIPVVDHPSDKAKVNFTIIAPDHYEVIATGKRLELETLSENRIKHIFASELEIPTKVMVFAASDFRITHYDSINGIPVSSWIFTDNQTGEMDYFPAVDAIEFFSDTIGPFIYSKLANVQSKTRYGGMENAGNIFYFENSVNGKNAVEALVVHEVAHHWFGNAVTEKDWQHIWLSEGFATYLTELYFENKYGEEVFKKRLIKKRGKVLKFGRNYSSKVVDDSVTDLMYLLNPNSYQKGAWVLHMLRQKVGDSVFYMILQQFFQKYKFSNASTEDFIDLSEDISGSDLSMFFEQWLYYPVNPNLAVDWFREGDSLYFMVEQVQTKYIYQLDLEIQLGGKFFTLPVHEKKNFFVLPSKHDLNPIFDPGIKLLAEINTSEKKFIGDSHVVFDEIRTGFSDTGSEPVLIDYDQRHLLEPGDLLFQDLDCGALCDAIESVTEGYKGADFSHVAMVTGIVRDTVYIFEAIGGEVKQTPLIDFLSRSKDENGNPKVMVGRIENDEITNKAINEVKQFFGKSYDDVFDIENDSYYCSELIYFAYREADRPIFRLFPMTFKNPETGAFDPAWIEYYKILEDEIPEGEPGLNPGGISRSPYVHMIYLFGNPAGYNP